MRRVAVGLLAVAGTATIASAQIGIDIVASAAVVNPGDMVFISIFADASAYAGPYNAIGQLRGDVVADGSAGSFFAIPVEDNVTETVSTDTFPAADTWTNGRRPGALNAGAGLFGSFRFPPQGTGPTDLAWATGTVADNGSIHDAVLSDSRTNGIEMVQQPEGFNPFANNSRRIELLRLKVTAGGPGLLCIDFLPYASAIYTAANGSPVAGNAASNGAAKIIVLPAPGAAALLGLGGLAVARRRR